jgi:hypothetical protein
MALPIIANTYRCAFNWHNSDTSTDATNVMHFVHSSSNPAAIAADIEANWTQNMIGFMPTHSICTEIVITPLDGSSVTFPYITPAVAHWHGPQTTQDVDPQVCALIKLVTAKRGRAYRGRVYLPFVSEAAKAAGQLDSTTVTNATTAWAAFVAAMASAGTHLAVASYKNSTQETVVAAAMEHYTATQRRRLKRNSST